MPLTIERIIDLLQHRAHGLYGGEAVTQREHALQCATLAQADGATPALITASLLHDLGHLLDDDDVTHPHEQTASRHLASLFGPAVTEPIRLHVDAKRYLCATDPAYWASLSPLSQRSLIWQGGVFSPGDAQAFILQPYAGDAVRLRRWDDAAKVPGGTTPGLHHFLVAMAHTAHDAVAAA